MLLQVVNPLAKPWINFICPLEKRFSEFIFYRGKEKNDEEAK
jgi:hypothetical protein